MQVYYHKSTKDELEAMLSAAAPVYDEARRHQWIGDCKARSLALIRQAFLAGDDDGDGGLSISEFAEAVALHKGERHPDRIKSDRIGSAELHKGERHPDRSSAADRSSASRPVSSPARMHRQHAASSSADALAPPVVDPLVDPWVKALFAAADTDGNGVVDEEEFVELVSHHAELRESFDHILTLGCKRRAAIEEAHLAQFQQRRASGRRQRPALSHLRKEGD